MKAMMIGFGKNPFPTIAEKIGSSIMVTGVPARNADKRVERPKVTSTARKMLSSKKVTSPVEISSEKPKNDKEFESMNNTAKIMIIFQAISFFISEKLELFEKISRKIAAATSATSAGSNPKIINAKEVRIMIIVVEKCFLFSMTIPGSSIDKSIFLFSSGGCSSFLIMNRSIKNMVKNSVIRYNIPILAKYSPKPHPNSSPIIKFFKLETGVRIAPIFMVMVMPII
jgi:hypothetical protein